MGTQLIAALQPNPSLFRWEREDSSKLTEGLCSGRRCAATQCTETLRFWRVFFFCRTQEHVTKSSAQKKPWKYISETWWWWHAQGNSNMYNHRGKWISLTIYFLARWWHYWMPWTDSNILLWSFVYSNIFLWIPSARLEPRQLPGCRQWWESLSSWAPVILSFNPLWSRSRQHNG